MSDKEKLKKNGGPGTNVGNALRWLAKQGKEFAPELLDLAGTVTGIGGLSALGDKIRSSDEIDPLDKELLLKELEYDMVEMVELTKRLQSDNEHPITRLVRPVTYAYAWVVYTFIMFFDGNVGTFTVQEGYLPMIENLIDIMTVFYFGSRGIEKIAKEVNKYRNK